MPVSVYLSSSFPAAWETLLLPWFKSVATSAFTENKTVAVVTPFASDGAFLRSKLIEHGISLLGVKFLTPAQLREALLRESGVKVPLREHLRLMLAVVAERFAAGKIGNEKIDVAIAKSVSRDPDSFLRAIDQLGAAGWSFDEFRSNALREIAQQFEKVVRGCGFQFVHETDRATVENAEKSKPIFGHLLVSGVSGAHWPSWPLLRAAVTACERAIIVLSDPRDEARDLDEAWVGTWEENFGVAEVIPAVTERSTASSEQIHFLVGRDTIAQARAIVALTARFLSQENCERIGILFSRGGGLPRLVATFLNQVKIAHNDGIAHLTPSVFDDDVWRTWLEVQESPRLKTLLHFLRGLPVKIFGRWVISEVEQILRGAYADVLIDDIGILRERLARQNADAEIVHGLEKIEFLPATASLSDFLERTEKICAQFGWIQRWREVERLSHNWTGCVPGSFSRRIYLRWLREILGAPSLNRDEDGAHPYSRVHLLRYAEAENQTWSHLIFAGMNDEMWPTMADDPGFIGEQEIDALNQKILNRRAVKCGRYGEGQWSVRENRTLFLGPTERRQIVSRQIFNLIESATAGIAVTANLYSESFPSRMANPSECFSRLYFMVYGQGVSQETMQALERQTRHWQEDAGAVAETAGLGGAVSDFENSSRADRGYNADVVQTRVAFDARRQVAPATKYEFALHSPPDRAVTLRVTDWEQALRWPALVWMKMFLGVEAEEENADLWAVSTGQWVHRWLAQAARTSNGDQPATGRVHVAAATGFVDLADAEEIRVRILNDARRFREEVQNLCAASARPVPDWWLSGWSNALYIADCLAEKLSGLSEWSRMAAEFSLGSPAIISLSENETLRLRGRVDLILARGKGNDSAIGYDDLWVVDYKTGKQRGFNLRELRKNETPETKLRKQLVDGRGIQLGLYALAVHAVGASRVQMTLLAPFGELEPQFSLEHVLAQKDFWLELYRMQQTGVFGMLGKILNEYGAARTYPLATLAIDPDLLREKWELTHPAFVVENDYGND